MGNCCSGGRQQDGVQLNDIKKDKIQRVARWRATGNVGLRAANLKELPAAVEELGKAVRVLDCSNNQITSLPPWLGKLANLQRLVVESNLLTTLPPEITDLASLKWLVVDSNRLAALPQRIGRMTALERLSVRGNALSSLPQSLGDLPNLTVLVVSSNRLADLPQALGSCTSLEELDASNNALQELPVSIGGLKRLKVLALDDNRIKQVPSEILTGCTSLHTLLLHSNPITAQALEETPGYGDFNKRRKSKVDKQITTGVMRGALDEGVDRKTTR